ncbi:YdbL family protein [Opitutales bacterium]|nr:YdbL family protein [Opitutales bacterium]
MSKLILSKTFIFLSFLSLTLTINSFADFSSRMKERLPEIVKAKNSGFIGEGTEGLVHVRGTGTKAVKKLADDENNDRKILFSAMSKKTGGSVDEVASKFSKALVKKSKKGHWFRKSSGKWIQRN